MSFERRRVDVTFETKLESIDLGEELARRVARTAGFDDDEGHKISMAVRESLINAFQHGNRQDARKHIGLSFLLYPDRLVVEVRDEGGGFDLAQVPDPLADESLLKTSGRGIFLIRCFMDEFQVGSRCNGGAVVTMIKYMRTATRQAQGTAETKENQP